MTKGYLRSIKSLLTSAALALSLAACAGHLGPVGSANGKGVFPVPSPIRPVQIRL